MSPVVARWKLERVPEPFDRRVLVGSLAVVGLGLWLWIDGGTRQLQGLGVIIMACAGLACLGLIGDRLGLIAFMRTDAVELELTTEAIRLRSGHVDRTWRFEDVIRVELHTRGQPEDGVLVLITPSDSTCPIPQAAWADLDIAKRLQHLARVRWDLMSEVLAATTETSAVVWTGRLGDATPFGSADASDEDLPN